jgi:hypothetical protein
MVSLPRLGTAIIAVIIIASCAPRDPDRTALDSGRIVVVRGDPSPLQADSVRALGFLTETLRVDPESVALRVGESWPVTRLRVRVLDARGRELERVPTRIAVADSGVAVLRRFQLEGVAPGRTALEVQSLLPRRDRPAPVTRLPLVVSP